MKKLTIMVSDEFYEGLKQRVGPRGIGRFLESAAQEQVFRRSLADHYREAAMDEVAERQASEWVNASFGDTLPPEDWSWLDDEAR